MLQGCYCHLYDATFGGKQNTPQNILALLLPVSVGKRLETPHCGDGAFTAADQAGAVSDPERADAARPLTEQRTGDRERISTSVFKEL